MSMVRGQRWLGWSVLLAGFAFLYLPILLLVLYSFNSSRLATVWAGFSTQWYGELFRDRQLLEAAWVSLKVAFWTATASMVLGTMAAMAMTRFRRFPLPESPARRSMALRLAQPSRRPPNKSS